MSTRNNLIIAACYAGTLMLGMIIGPKFSKENNNSGSGSFIASRGEGDKVEKIINIIREKYVDPVNTDSLQNLAINEVLKGLDPHSAYLPPVEAKQLSDELEGNYNGIGVEYHLLNDTLLITGVNKNGPAAKAGLKTGDRILKINGTNIAGVGTTSKKVVELIRGRRGTAVKLSIRRKGLAADKLISVLRDKIVVSSIDAAYMLSAGVGYIKISKFGARTDDDFIADLNSLKKQGMKSLILDLRENGGGYLNAATALSDQFLPGKKLIVYTEGSHEPRTDYFAGTEGSFESGKLVVLIDENTASASEIVAGAIQDLDRGVIVGRRSFGKGLVQEQFNFGDGSALNLTVARYYTPSGRSIQKSYKEGPNAYYEEVLNRYKNGELISSPKELTDSLYKKGKIYKTSSGRLMYGGGGIMPDVYVPLDTAGYNDLYYALNAKGVLSDFLYNDLVKEDVKPSSVDILIRNFQLGADHYSKLLARAAQKGVKYNDSLFKAARRHISHDLKAMLARYYFGEEGYFRVLTSDDNAILRSLEVLQRP